MILTDGWQEGWRRNNVNKRSMAEIVKGTIEVSTLTIDARLANVPNKWNAQFARLIIASNDFNISRR